MKKGQLTFEYLFLTAISLVLISISISALLKAKEAGDKAYAMAAFKSTAAEIYEKSEELCALGSGNSLPIMALADIDISHDDQVSQISFSNPNLNISVSKPASCALSYQKSISRGSQVTISNYNGEISIS